MTQIVVSLSADVEAMSLLYRCFVSPEKPGNRPGGLEHGSYSVPFCPKVSHLRVGCDSPGLSSRAAHSQTI